MSIRDNSFGVWTQLTLIAAMAFSPRALVGDRSVFGEFVGTTPCTEAIQPFLTISSHADQDNIRWKLTLYQDPKTRAPAGYKLQYEHEKATWPASKLVQGKEVVQKEGTWTVSKGTKFDSDAVVYELDGAVSLFELNSNILHVLNPDRSLMIGTGGWSYTLNRAEKAEKPGDPVLAATGPDRSYPISAAASGPTVYGVFEGRTPCIGIAQELKIPKDAGCTKVKWRVTLYQNPETQAPTTYTIEGSLHRQAPRKGTWGIIPGKGETIFRLEATKTEPALFLRKGDENVLFFVDQKGKPLVGHADFSYTLNRRAKNGA